jgi:hypothetical protein
MGHGLNSSGSEQGQVAGFCRSGNDSSCSIKLWGPFGSS